MADDDWNPFEDPANVATVLVERNSSVKGAHVDLQYTAGEQSTSPNIEGSTTASTSAFTPQKAIQMQDELIAGYIEMDFQERLFTALGRVFGDKVRMSRVQSEVCWPIQAPILERFGFERSKKGLRDSYRAFTPYKGIPDVDARNEHMQYLIRPSKQDLQWKGEVKRKFDLETGLHDNTSLPPLLTLKQGLEIQDALIAEYSKPEFQDELVKALKQAGDDEIKQTRIRQRLCYPVQLPVLTKYGFEPSRKGVHLSIIAFNQILMLYPEIAERGKMLAHLMNHDRNDVLAMPLGDFEVPEWEDEVPPNDAKQNTDSAPERLTCIPGVGLSICEGTPSQKMKFQEQEIRHREHRPEVALSEDALLCTQFVLDAPYPQVLHELTQMAAFDKGMVCSFEHDSDGKLFVFSPDGYTWMQESLSVAMPVEGVFAHRITIVHTVALSLHKRQGDRRRLAEDIWQRRLYTYTEINDFFRFVPAENSRSDRTLVSRSICGLEIAFEGDTQNLRPQLVKRLEDDNDKWITHFKSNLSETVLQATSADGTGNKDYSKSAREYAKDAKHKGTTVLAEEEALALQDDLIAGYSTCEFQERLHIAHAIASMADKDVEVHQKRAQAQTCFLVQAAVLPRFGFEPSRLGVMQSVRAFAEFDSNKDCYKGIAARNDKMIHLVTVEMQSREEVEEFLCKFAQGPAPSHIVLKAGDLYQADKELVSLAADGLVAHMRLRLQFQNADANIVVPTIPSGLSAGIMLDGFLFSMERTPLIVAVESGQLAVFNLLLNFCPMVDVNVVCCEYQIEGPYKRYTALDKAMMAKHKDAPDMIAKLIVAGAKSAYDLGRPRRPNPFFDWEVHFPRLQLSRLQLQDIEFYKKMALKEPDVDFFKLFVDEDKISEEAQSNTDRHKDKNQMRAQPWRWPPAPTGQDQELEDHINKIKDQINQSQTSNIQGQHRLLRQLFLQWHPDKQRGDTKLAHKVFLWLQELREKTLC